MYTPDRIGKCEHCGATTLDGAPICVGCCAAGHAGDPRVACVPCVRAELARRRRTAEGIALSRRCAEEGIDPCTEAPL